MSTNTRKPNEDLSSSSLTPLLERETPAARPDATSGEDNRLSTSDKNPGSVHSPAYDAFAPLPDTSASTSTDVKEHNDEASRQNRNVKPRATPQTPSAKPMSKWAVFRQDTWARNGGSILVIIAMFFGALMSLTTQLLETDNRNGHPMHPFQVSHRHTGHLLHKSS